jgi:hypothetical protein
MPAAVQSEVRPDVRSFFERYQQATDSLDSAAVAESFQDFFLNLDPGSATPVSRDALIKALPGRGQLFASIGATGADLATIAESPLDEQHTLVTTTWTVRFGAAAGPGAPSGSGAAVQAARPLTLRSTFLLRREAGGPWRIVVYLNHQDIVGMIRDRAAGAQVSP